MKTLEELIEAHKTAMAERAGSRVLAELEAAIREAAPAHLPRTPYHLVIRWEAETLGVTQHVISCHRDLWNVRGPAEALWERVDAGMPLGTAKRLAQQARRHAGKRDREGLKRAIEAELQRFEYRPGAVQSPTSDVALPAADLAPREFLQRLRKSIMEHLEPRVGQLPEHERDTLLEDFERDLQALLSQHNHKWQRLSRVIQDQKRVSRQKFVNALRLLHMDPPRRNAPLEPLLAQANKQKRTLARLYHPDTQGGSHHTTAQYQAVLDAFLVVEQYVAENNAPARKPKLRLVNGGE